MMLMMVMMVIIAMVRKLCPHVRRQAPGAAGIAVGGGGGGGAPERERERELAQGRHQQPNTYPHPPVPAAKLFFVSQCFPVFSATSRNPEVGGGDHFWGSSSRA